jgi:hypothetical protein
LEDSRPRLLKFAFALDAYEATIPIMESHFEVQLVSELVVMEYPVVVKYVMAVAISGELDA